MDLEVCLPGDDLGVDLDVRLPWDDLGRTARPGRMNAPGWTRRTFESAVDKRPAGGRQTKAGRDVTAKPAGARPASARGRGQSTVRDDTRKENQTFPRRDTHHDMPLWSMAGPHHRDETARTARRSPAKRPDGRLTWRPAAERGPGRPAKEVLTSIGVGGWRKAKQLGVLSRQSAQ